MSLSIGIVGLPNVGKSTLFNALTNNDVLAANYPFATIEPNTGIVPVPDARLEKLSELYHGAPIKPATVEFVDIAGLVAGASRGEGLGNKFLANIRECRAIVHVVRAFTDPDVIRTGDEVNPALDIETINTELMLADIETIDRVEPRLAKEAKTSPMAKKQLAVLIEIKNNLEKGNISALKTIMQTKGDDADIQKLIKQIPLLSTKPVIYLFNVDEADLNDTEKQACLSKIVEPESSLFVNAALESELQSLSTEDALELLQSYGQTESSLNKVINSAYSVLGLQSYLTAGDKEVRAWTIPIGATAPQAAGVIHGDFERGFIAAEIISYDDLMEAGSLVGAKSAGKVRTEGKSYIMQPGDIVEFRFNV